MESGTIDACLRRYGRIIANLPSKVWRAICIAFFTVELFGVATLLAFCTAGATGATKSDESKESDDKDATRHQRYPMGRLARSALHALVVDTMKELSRPASVLIPVASTVLALRYYFRVMDTLQTTFSGTEEYHTSCPETLRRKQTEVLTRLFATYVTTVGVHSYRHYLTGESSWRYTAFFAIDVLMSPLASVLVFAQATWSGFIDLFIGCPRSCVDITTLNYRLARMCHVRVAVDKLSGSGGSMHLASINPRHIKAVPLQRDLRWLGRTIILIILLGRYLYATSMLTRRLLSNTAGIVDIATLCLIFSCQTALIRCVTISLLNSSWNVEDGTAPCDDTNCRLSLCVDLRNQENPKTPFRIVVFGCDVTHIPITIFYESVGGYVQLAILCHSQDSIWTILWQVLTLRICWRLFITLPLSIHTMWKLGHNNDQSTAPAATEKGADPHLDSTLPGPVSQNHRVSSPDRPKGPPPSYTGSILLVVLHAGGFFTGICGILISCLLIVLQLAYQVGVAVMLYRETAHEMVRWKDSVPTVPCPELWKDQFDSAIWAW